MADLIIERAMDDLKNDDVKVRKEAIESLVGVNNPIIIDDLIKATTDENAQVRFKAATILGNFGKEAFDKLVQEYKNAEGKNKRFMAYALKETKNPEAIQYFVEDVTNSDFGVRKIAIRALGELNAVDYIDIISEGLTDEDSGVRSSAIFALGDIATEESIAIIKNARRNESDKDFKKYCNKAIKKAEKILKARENGEIISKTLPVSRIKEMEKTNITKAIKEYEKYVEEGQAKDAPYKRLVILYRKNNNYDDEVRVLNKAIEVFEDNPKKLAYFKKRLDKLSN